MGAGPIRESVFPGLAPPWVSGLAVDPDLDLKSDPGSPGPA